MFNLSHVLYRISFILFLKFKIIYGICTDELYGAVLRADLVLHSPSSNLQKRSWNNAIIQHHISVRLLRASRPCK